MSNVLLPDINNIPKDMSFQEYYPDITPKQHVECIQKGTREAFISVLTLLQHCAYANILVDNLDTEFDLIVDSFVSFNQKLYKILDKME